MAAAGELPYTERGSGPAVVLVHGTGPGFWWSLPQRLESAGRRVIIYDRRGFGDAPGPPGQSVREHAEDLAQVIQSAGAEPAAIVGWSWGGLVALDLAARRPVLASGLVLLEPPFQVAKGLNAGFAGMRAIGGAIIGAKLGRHETAAFRFAKWGLGRTDGPSDFERMAPEEQARVREDARATVAELEARDTGEHLDAELLGRIRCPVVWFVGDVSQPALRRGAERAERLVPGIRIVRAENSGHAIQKDAPEAVTEAVLGL